MGKIDITTLPIESGYRLWPGMLVSMILKESNSRIYFASSVEILDAPMSGVDLSWIHNLLEITYYFSPLHSEAQDVFRILYRAGSFVHFNEYLSNHFSTFKKLFIVSLFNTFGFYPDSALAPSFKEFEKLVLASVDFPDMRALESLRILLDGIDLRERQFINKWIKTCLNRHPNARFLKSVSFLNI